MVTLGLGAHVHRMFACIHLYVSLHACDVLVCVCLCVPYTLSPMMAMAANSGGGGVIVSSLVCFAALSIPGVPIAERTNACVTNMEYAIINDTLKAKRLTEQHTS